MTFASGLACSASGSKSTKGSKAMASTRHRDTCLAHNVTFVSSSSAGRIKANCSSMWYVLSPSSARAATMLVVPVCPTLGRMTLRPELKSDSAARPASQAQATSLSRSRGRQFQGMRQGHWKSKNMA
eukprot:CAMPEP_0183384942 /NCGR_PEP_ID=MMETSP0370-20130417/1004_1 /TAXON_ID=268820 /ORGANISM="Peridinium aciculiferum, Strain PAER-2" /LENGTH=126 /DNA_ID=CAMNT_0025562811 /DNA_START=605 /DNA_END=985 /DNA_ORIENTATION=+